MQPTSSSTKQAIYQQFLAMEQQILHAESFAKWRASFELKTTFTHSEPGDIKCDLDIRLAHWPEGVVIKLYKHKALAILPAVKDPATVSENLDIEPMAVKFWKDSYYFSKRTDLDEGRYVLREGNDMELSHAQQCLDRLIEFIVDIEQNLDLAER